MPYVIIAQANYVALGLRESPSIINLPPGGAGPQSQLGRKNWDPPGSYELEGFISVLNNNLV